MHWLVKNFSTTVFLHGLKKLKIDLRFGSTIGWVDDIQVRRHGKPTTFRIMARVAPDGRVSAVRFITTTGAGGDSGWNPPVE